MKKIFHVLMLVIVISSFSVLIGVTDDAMMDKALNISAAVPKTGSATLGTVESMKEFQGWLNDCSDQLISLFNQIMDLFGLSHMDYVTKMQTELEKGQDQANTAANPSGNR